MNTYKTIAIIFFILINTQVFSQEKFTLSGKIKDGANGEDMIGATVFIKELNTGIVSNEYGFYSITLPSGK